MTTQRPLHLVNELTNGSKPWRALKIAMIGQKGLPATYGGIEHHVEQLGQRLAARGHHVSVFNRRAYATPVNRLHLGMEVKNAPTISSKHLDAIVHSASSTALAIASKVDIVHYHALGPGLIAPAARATSRAAIIQTVHGLDHERGKWGRAASAVLGAGHWMSGHVPDRTVVVSGALRDHYEAIFGRHSVYIPNGVSRPKPVSSDVLRSEWGLIPGQYLLFVGRFVPEKSVDLLLEAYREVPGECPLVLVGDSSHSDDYVARLRTLAAKDPRVILAGYLFGESLSAVYQHAGAFVQPSLVEGMPLTMLEALSHQLPVVASDIAPHLEVLGDDAGPECHVFRAGDAASLRHALHMAVKQLPRQRDAGRALSERILQRFDWDQAALQLEQVYFDALVARERRRQPSRARPRPVALG